MDTILMKMRAQDMNKTMKQSNKCCNFKEEQHLARNYPVKEDDKNVQYQVFIVVMPHVFPWLKCSESIHQEIHKHISVQAFE